MLLRELLTELKMAPTSLKKMASNIKGLCGIEFELYVPNMNTGDEDDEENDYSVNPWCYSIDDIERFYSDTDTGNLDEICRKLTEDYQDWAYQRIGDQFSDEADSVVREYIEENDWDEDEQYQEAYDELIYSEEEIAVSERWRNGSTTVNDASAEFFNKARARVEEMLDEKVEESINDRDRNYEDARESWEESAEWPDEQDFLRWSGIQRMSDVEDNYNVYWPFQYGDSSGGQDMTALASEFEQAIGRKAFGCKKGYHGCDSEKGKDQYVLETDSSLSDPKAGFGGVEIVAPTLPLSEMVDEIKEVIEWAKNYGCYTDYHCGLHVNISIEDIPMDQLDYVKMVLFVGDQHVLKEFGRLSSTYAKSAFKQLQQKINYQPNLAYEVLGSLQQNLANAAGKLIHSGTTEKMVSLNSQAKRLEVRSPGGDWMNEDISKLETMVYRFIVALDIACDPQKNKEEYAKKMYKLIKPDNTSGKWANTFSQYNAGVINIDSLKQELSSASTKNKPTIPVQAKTYDNSWEVTAFNGQQLIVKADSAIAAVNIARAQLKLNSVQYPNNSFSVQPIPQADIFNQFGSAKPPTTQPMPPKEKEVNKAPSVYDKIAQHAADKAQGDIFPSF